MNVRWEWPAVRAHWIALTRWGRTSVWRDVAEDTVAASSPDTVKVCIPTIVRRNRFLQRKRFLSIAWSVCLSVVCHIRAPCLNRSTELQFVTNVYKCF